MTNITRRLNEASNLLRSGRRTEAAAIYQAILSQNPRQPEALRQAAALARQSGDLKQALDLLEQAIAVTPADPQNYFLCGLTLEDLGRPEEAIERLRDALRVKPDYAEAHNNIGIILHDRKRFEEAVACFREALRINPGYARACNNLGTSLRALNDLPGARQQFERAAKLKPDYALAHFNLGVSCMDLGQLPAAEASFSQAIQVKPDYAQAFLHLGFVQREMGKLDQAQAAFARAAQLKPGKNSVELNNLGHVFWEQGRIEQTVAAYRQAQAVAPHSLKAALGSLLSLPAVYGSRSDLLKVRERFAEGLRILHSRVPEFVANNPVEALLDDLRWNNFYLAYQGLDDKELQLEYARFVQRMLQSIAPQFLQPRARKPSAGRKLRIGFLSAFFMDCTVGMYFRSWIMRLDPRQFETCVYYVRPEADRITREIADASTQFRHLAGGSTSTASIATAVLNDDLDILVYPELGMDSTSFLLAAMRLAPVQCAAWGHPVTTGHPNIDYYFSSAAMEPGDGAEHYSEKLVLLDGIGTCYHKPALPSPGRRADYSLPEGKTLYLCPQSLFKIHPDNDALLARVLERDPNGVILLFAGRHPNITSLLFARLRQALEARGIDPKGRGIILPSMPHDDYLRVNMLCDVMLDTLHWSGGNTTLDALASALPVVTWPGRYMRGRQSFGMLTCLGLQELIAQDESDYVEKAVRLGTDQAWREQVVQHIRNNIDVIFDVETPLRQLEQFYLSRFSPESGAPARDT